MILALDYDGTYTKDPVMWQKVISVFRASGHEVFCCTMRTPEEVESVDPALLALVQVIPTSRKAKGPFLKDRLIEVDIWIDDNPMVIIADAGDCPTTRPQTPQAALQSAPKSKARMTLSKSFKGDANA